MLEHKSGFGWHYSVNVISKVISQMHMQMNIKLCRLKDNKASYDMDTWFSMISKVSIPAFIFSSEYIKYVWGIAHVCQLIIGSKLLCRQPLNLKT